ncbi:MAG: CGGC domain-containing protein [Acidaminococcaceae bacterium]|nr:CGGC domain-containing protein [Acidaminococcaceae bacterium]
MTKISILACKITGDRCAGAGCLRAVRERNKAFADYGPDTELIAMWRCNGCGHFIADDEGLKKKADRLLDLGVEYLHISHCAKKKDTKEPCPEIEGVAAYLQTKGVKIVRGTH